MGSFSNWASTFLAVAVLTSCAKAQKGSEEKKACPAPQEPSTQVSKETETLQPSAIQPLRLSNDKKSIAPLREKISKVFGCDKSDSEQLVSSEGLANRILIEDRIESKTVEKVSCSGRVRKVVRPTQAFKKVLDIEPPAGLASSVGFLEIENQKTCAQMRVRVIGDQPLNEEFEGLIRQSWSGRGESIAAKSGALKLVVSENILFSSTELPVRDGLNAIKIRYFGECQEKDDKGMCRQAQLLGSKEAVVEIKVDRPLGSKVEQMMENEKACL